MSSETRPSPTGPRADWIARHRRQIKLERTSWKEGLRLLREAGPISFLGAFRRDFLAPVVARVKAAQDEVLTSGKGGRLPVGALPLIGLEAEELALIAVSCMLKALGKVLPTD